MTTTYNIAVVGATGAVGEAMLALLAERNFPCDNIVALASEASEGDVVLSGKRRLTVQTLVDFDFSETHIALFSAGSELSKQYVPIAVEAGCIVIDNTSAFRLSPDVPLVIPEINAHALANFRDRNIIANPNCSTIQLLMALNPIHQAVGIDRIQVATYQSVSGVGSQGVKTLAKETSMLLNGTPAEDNDTFAHQISFNLLPQIGPLQENGYTQEEMKMVLETQKIWEDDDVKVNATCVRVPVFYGHSEVISIETLEPFTAKAAKDVLAKAPGVVLLPDDNYPTPLSHGSDSDAVAVSRVRADISHPNGLTLWCVGDNLRKGAALNAVQIAEKIILDF